jgi:hypothetical protein
MLTINQKSNTILQPNKSTKNYSSRGSRKSRYGKKQNQRKGQKPVVAPRGPVKEYVSLCCSMPATKPKAGRKETAQDPENKKPREVVKGLGHWHCIVCNKPCKVKVQMPAPKVEVPANNVAISVEVPVENVATLPA